MPKIGIAIIGCGDIARARYFPAIEVSPDFELDGVQSRTSSSCEPIVRALRRQDFCRPGRPLRRSRDRSGRDRDAPSEPCRHFRSRASKGQARVMRKAHRDFARRRQPHPSGGRSVGQVFMALPFDRSPPIEEANDSLRRERSDGSAPADAVLAHRGPKHAPWFFDREKAGWGVSADLGIYLISQLTYFFGPAQRVCGRVETVFPERTSESGETIKVSVDDNVAAIVEWPDSVLATIRANWCSPSDHRNVICETRIYGTEGLDLYQSCGEDASDRRAFARAPCPRRDNGRIQRHVRLLRAGPGFVAGRQRHHALLRRADPRRRRRRAQNALRQRHVIEIIDKLYAASLSGAAAKLETN